MKDYISEISSPSISPDNLSGIEVQSYLRLLESARQSFIGNVAQYPKNAIKAYLNELMEAKNVIIKRGFIGMEQPALEMVQADIKEAELIYIFSILDKGMMQSLEKTASFLQQVIGEEQPTEPQPQPIIEQPQPEEKDEKQNVVEGVKVISGTQGLADYLGCSKSMAFGIISRGVLKDIGIQYMVGKCWKFNREKLDKYLKEHPDLLANVRCKR
jgi:hypothetical protein